MNSSCPKVTPILLDQRGSLHPETVKIHESSTARENFEPSKIFMNIYEKELVNIEDRFGILGDRELICPK